MVDSEVSGSRGEDTGSGVVEIGHEVARGHGDKISGKSNRVDRVMGGSGLKAPFAPPRLPDRLLKIHTTN